MFNFIRCQWGEDEGCHNEAKYRTCLDKKHYRNYCLDHLDIMWNKTLSELHYDLFSDDFTQEEINKTKSPESVDSPAPE